MDIEVLILINVIGLSVALFSSALMFACFMIDELKLAKHGESSIFGRKGKK